MSENNNQQLEKENAELKAQVAILASRSSLLATEAYSSNDEIDLRELWNAIWNGKWIIIAVTFVFAVASVIYALSLPDEYKSTAILAPISNSNSSQLSKLAGQFGGLASLAGINLGGSAGGEDKAVIAMEIIQTWGFLEKFIENNNIQVEVFAAKDWNRTTDKLIIDADIYDIENKKWVREFDANKGQKAEPSSWELFEKIKDRISISKDEKSGLIRLSVEYFSPVIAKEWTDKLIMAINEHIKKQDRQEALNSIQYLNEQINKTTVADMRKVFFQLIEEQSKTLMLAETRDEYVFNTVSPAKIMEEKSKPNRGLIIFFTGLFGFLIVITFVVLRVVANKKDRAAS